MPVVDYGHKVSLTGASRYEKVETADGGDGKWHYIDRQNLDYSCGPACVRIVTKMITDTVIGEAYFAGLIGASEQGGSGGVINPLSAQAQGHNFNAYGCYPSHLATALKDCKIGTAHMPSSLPANWGTVWSSCTLKTPAIAGVLWVGPNGAPGGGHFIVMAGPLAGSATRILVLDPHYGVQQMDLATPTVYHPRRGGGNTGQILATGNLGFVESAYGDAVLTTK
jgi:hypothetical protein